MSDETVSPSTSHTPNNFSITTSIAVSEGNQSRLVMASTNHTDYSSRWSGYSTNGGQSFIKLSTVQYATAIALDPANSNRAYLVGKANNDTVLGLYYTNDMGTTWTLHAALPSHIQKVTCLASNPTVTGKVYIGTDGNSYYTTTTP